ncbi:FeMo cofactor biosynthesis protein NifB [compost metagenome]
MRYEGREAAELLISRQLQGLEMLAKLGILVKVNSIMIPGVNDHHLPAVSKRVKELGASLHNVTPLIIAPGSQYEADGRKAPRPKELHNLQELLGRDGMKVMRHCRQCRADAIGLLGQDRNQDFPLEAMEADPVINQEARAQFQSDLDTKIRERVISKQARVKGRWEDSQKTRVAVATRGGDKVNQHFGHATEFLIYDTDGAEVKLIGVRKIQAYCHGKADCNGDKAATLQEIISILSDCRILLCSGIGDGPRASLNKIGVLPLVRKGGIQEAILESVKYSSYFENINISKG